MKTALAILLLAMTGCSTTLFPEIDRRYETLLMKVAYPRAGGVTSNCRVGTDRYVDRAKNMGLLCHLVHGVVVTDDNAYPHDWVEFRQWCGKHQAWHRYVIDVGDCYIYKDPANYYPHKGD